MCPPPKTPDQFAGVINTGSIGNIGGDLVGGDKITYGIDDERLIAILELFIPRRKEASAFLSRWSPPQLTLERTQPSALRHPSEITRDLISHLRGSLQEIVDLISDLDNDRDINLANNRLSEWKIKTDRVVNNSFKSGNLHFQMRLYDITSDANQRTPFNKIKNEARKCQKVIADLLRELE